MMRPLTSLLAALALSVLAAGPGRASAQTPITEEPHIVGMLVAVRVADAIRQSCPSVHARYLAVLQQGEALKSYARKQGYTEDDVKSLRTDAAKARLKALAADYLKQHGAAEGDADSFCRLGRAEIEKGSAIGSLLRAD